MFEYVWDLIVENMYFNYHVSFFVVELEKPEVETHNSGNPMRLNLKQLGNDLVHRSLIQYIGMSFPTV